MANVLVAQILYLANQEVGGAWVGIKHHYPAVGGMIVYPLVI